MTDPQERFSREGILAFAEQLPFFNLIGLEVVDIEPGWSKTRIGYRPDLTQPAGILHGGVIASLIDTGIAHALLLTESFRDVHDQGAALVSIDLRVKYMRPVSEGTIECEAKILRQGRQILHAEAVVTGADGKEVARGDATYMAVAGKRLGRG